MEPCRRIVILKIGENPDDFKYYGNSNLGDILELRENLDNKEFLQMGYQNLRNGFWAGEDATVTVSEANVIPAPSDPGSITVNSYFGELHEHTAEETSLMPKQQKQTR